MDLPRSGVEVASLRLSRISIMLKWIAGQILAGVVLVSILGEVPCRAAVPDILERTFDVAVFGGTPAGVMAAVAAGKQGRKVVLLESSYVVGGMMSGGLTKTDIGNRSTVGGLSVEFFKRVESYYREAYGADSEQVRDCHGGLFFEPHVAELVFSRLLAEAGVEVHRKEQLQSAQVSANRIASIVTRHYETGARSVFRAKVFVDATYEGDLLAAAGVPYRVGREAAAEYNESLAGLTEGPGMYRGKGDHRVQSYNFRSTLTTRDDIRLPIPKPEHYTPGPHRPFIDSVLRDGHKTFEDLFHDAPLWGPINGKSDPNKADYPGANYNYPEADYEQRAEIAGRVRDYWLSLWYMLQNDPELPESFKESARRWGLPSDEFVESGHVSPQIYVREARRMLGRYMLTQNDVERFRQKPDTIALGSYNIDSHDVARFLTPEGIVNDGYLISNVDPYEIPYRVLTPFAPSNLLVTCAVSATHIAYGSLRMEPVFMMIGQAAGIASDLAIGDGVAVQDVPITRLQERLTSVGIPLKAPFRPVVRISGPGGSVEPGKPVRFDAEDLIVDSPLTYYWNFDGSGKTQSNEKSPEIVFPVAKPVTVSLKAIDRNGRESLVELKQITVGSGGHEDLSVKVKDASLTGRWDRGGAASVENRGRVNYHDMNSGKGNKRADFTTEIPETGLYRVAFAFQEGRSRAKSVPVTITHAGGESTVHIDQQDRGTVFAFVPVGDFKFEAGSTARVSVSNAGTDGYVSIDEVRWIWLGEASR